MEKLIKLRKRFNLSRKDISDILGRPIKFVVDVEKNNAALNRADIKRLCDHFSLDEGFFVTLSEKPTDISEWDEVLGRNVKHFRELSGMTQQILAEELGFAGPASISGIERGIKPIGKKALLRLADLFDIHVSELFNYHDPSVVDSYNRLIGKFNYILDHKRKPKNWEALLKEVEAACKDLAGH